MTARARLRRSVNWISALVPRSIASGRILLYHEIGLGRRADTIDVATWRAHLEAIATLGLGVSTVNEAVTAKFATPTISMSLDDGHVSAADACGDLLTRGWRATLFVVPGWIGLREGQLDWTALRDLAEHGIEVGAHGFEHERLCLLPVARAAAILQGARQELEHRIGRPTIGLAYPEGLVTPAVRQAAAVAGYRYACGTVPGRNRRLSDRFALFRNEITSADTTRGFIAKLRGADDWFGPIRALEIAWRCRTGARADASR